MLVDSSIMDGIRRVLQLIDENELSTLFAMTRNNQISEEELRSALTSVGEAIAVPSGDALAEIDHSVVDPGPPKKVLSKVCLRVSEDRSSSLFMDIVSVEMSPGLWVKELHDLYIRRPE